MLLPAFRVGCERAGGGEGSPPPRWGVTRAAPHVCSGNTPGPDGVSVNLAGWALPSLSAMVSPTGPLGLRGTALPRGPQGGRRAWGAGARPARCGPPTPRARPVGAAGPLTSRLSNFFASVMWIQLSFSTTLMCFTSSLNLRAGRRPRPPRSAPRGPGWAASQKQTPTPLGPRLLPRPHRGPPPAPPPARPGLGLPPPACLSGPLAPFQSKPPDQPARPWALQPHSSPPPPLPEQGPWWPLLRPGTSPGPVSPSPVRPSRPGL